MMLFSEKTAGLRVFKSAEEMRDFYKVLDKRWRALAMPAQTVRKPKPTRIPLTPIQRIITAVAKTFDLPREAVRGDPLTSQIVGLLATEMTSMSYEAISNVLGVKVTPSRIETVLRKVAHDQNLTLKVRQLRKELV